MTFKLFANKNTEKSFFIALKQQNIALFLLTNALMAKFVDILIYISRIVELILDEIERQLYNLEVWTSVQSDQHLI